MRLRIAIIMLLAACALPAYAMPPGNQAFLEVKRCAMDNDPGFCHRIITPSSYELFDRFSSYKLMPCLPTDFVYEEEETSGGVTTVKASMPAGNNTKSILHMVFVGPPSALKLDIPQTFARGMGPNWQNKIQMSEQVYLMMRQNMGDKLNCDMLTGLLKR